MNWLMSIIQMVKADLFLVTHNGYGLWFDEEEVSVVGIRAAGVKGINLKEDDYVIGGKILAKDSKGIHSDCYSARGHQENEIEGVRKNKPC